MVHYKQGFVFISLSLILLFSMLSGAFAQSTVNAPAAPAPSHWLIDVFNKGAEALEKEMQAETNRAGEVQSTLAKTTGDLQALQLRIAMMKTAMEIRTISPAMVDELLKSFSAKNAELSSEANAITDEIKELDQRRAKRDASASQIEEQTLIIRSSKESGIWSEEMELAYEKYKNAGSKLAGSSSGLVNALTGKLNLVKEEKELLDGILPRLKSLQEDFMAKILERGETKSFRQQFADLQNNLGALPGQGWHWFTGLLSSGRIQAFLLQNLAALAGLLLLIPFLGWGSSRLKRNLESMMMPVASGNMKIGLRLLINLACCLISLVHPIAFLTWLTVAYAVLGLFGVVAALIVYFALAGLLVLAMAIRMIRNLLGIGTDKHGIIQINKEKAGSFHHRLVAFSTYVVMGFVLTGILGLNKFPITVKLFFNHLYEVGVLAWTCLLLRPDYLRKTIAHPPGWISSKWLRSLWTALPLLMISALFMRLLGFQSLSIYTIHAAVLTEAIVFGVLLLALTGKDLLKEFFERENVLLAGFGSVQIQLRQFYFPARLVLSATLIAGSIAGLLWAWGVGITSMAVFLGHLGKGVNLGSFHLSPFTICASALILYVVFRGSSFCRTLLRHRVFPRTGWDLGVQYSIATIIQYMIIIAGVLLAMNILGFPLASLALLAGAMGIGAGLGLQNVIANFVSGLVLLFERPVKVGDMLVVDGQWGEVKAIKIRSTVFQTFDRSVLIIPNSDLLSGKIVNWTHFGIGPNRLAFNVGVSYRSDVKMVTRVLQDICSANPRVMKNPAPQVFFKAYGDSSLDFRIEVFVHTPSDRTPATHEINTSIFEAFQEKGIEIPFPQRDLHIIDDRITSSNGKATPDQPEWVQIPENRSKYENTSGHGDSSTRNSRRSFPQNPGIRLNKLTG